MCEHQGNGCRCIVCGLIQDSNWKHDWKKDCEHCAQCGKTRANAHTWYYCKCTACGKIRDAEHTPDCKCRICGKLREEFPDSWHAWGVSFTTGVESDCQKCGKCGKTRNVEPPVYCLCDKCKAKSAETCPQCGKKGLIERLSYRMGDNVHCPVCGYDKTEWPKG